MIGKVKLIAMGAGVFGAASTATYLGVTPESQTPVPVGEVADDGFEICLKTDIPFFEDVSARCYSRSDVKALRDARIINWQANPVSLTLTHPSDISVAPVKCATCRDYLELQWEGWFALTAKDMRREAFFVRACGFLKMLEEAAPASEQYFAPDGPTPEALIALGAENIPQIGDDPAISPGELAVEAAPGRSGWVLRADGQETRMEEIATADFDRDGVAEMLVFLYIRIPDGSAAAAQTALLEQDQADAPLTVTPIEFFSENKRLGEQS